MRLVHRRPVGDRVVEPSGLDDTTPVVDLVAALEPETPAVGVVVDGCHHGLDGAIGDLSLYDGSVVTVLAAPHLPAPPAARSIAVTGGLRAGSAFPLPGSGVVDVGRGSANAVALDEPTLSRRHLRFRVDGDRVTVSDLRSRNGTAVDGEPAWRSTAIDDSSVIRAGAVRLACPRPIDDVPLAVAAGIGSRSGRVPFNRPPRPDPPAEPTPLAVPAGLPDPPAKEPFSWAGFCLPLVAGAFMAIVFSPRMAIFAALGSALTVGSWLERRRRRRKTIRTAERTLAAGLERLDVELGPSREQERHRMRQLVPDLAEVARRGAAPSVRCWERRPADADAFTVGLGVADVAWSPMLAVDGGGCPAPEALAAIAALPRLADHPIAVDLAPGEVVGVVGERSAARAIARSLVLQAAVHHGPADLAMVVLGAPSDDDQWAWVRWLPHTADAASGRPGRLVASATNHATAVIDLLRDDPTERATLVVVDGHEWLVGRGAPGRALLGLGRTGGVVCVDHAHELPATCTTVVEVVDPAGRLRIIDPRSTAARDDVLAWGVPDEVATDTARRMARLDDPELASSGAGLPTMVSLLTITDLHEPDVAGVERRWQSARGTADVVVPIGADAHGVVEIDLVADGPHLLVGGTTGSGKSELLRSFVAGAALTADPDHVAFVLIDYKGGAAFDRCRDLPHVAGLVTDLDEHLAERAMRCLDAELHHRESVLRAVGADDVAAYRRVTLDDPTAEPMPRLLVVVDEFASLAAELPEFLKSLVGIAQRGRSLGVHMVLATQRPSGAVTEDIRANTGARIALRVTDARDSVDVIGAADASAIGRDQPGRAVARLGPTELLPFQSALVTGRTETAGGVRLQEMGSSSAAAPEGTTDLDRIVVAVSAAHRALGGRPPRTPWPAPLPADLDLADQAGRAGLDPAGFLVDDPDGQTQRIEGWSPDDGNLLVIGQPGSGTTTTVSTLVLDVARRVTADDVHVHVLDIDGDLAPLGDLAHVGTLAGPVDVDRRLRLLRYLADEIDRRRATGLMPDDPSMVVVLDGVAGLRRAHDPVQEPEVHEVVNRIWADGPSVAITTIATADRAADVPSAWIATTGDALLHRTGDPADGLRFGVRVGSGELADGRAVRVSDQLELQVARPARGDLAAAIAAMSIPAATDRPPTRLGELPAEIDRAELPTRVQHDGPEASLTFALGDKRLRPATLTLHRGEHAMLLGPPRSGRTTALATIGSAASAGDPDAVVVVADADSELARRLGVEPLAPETLTDWLTGRDHGLVLVDDATDVADPTGVLAALVAGSHPAVHIVAAGRADKVRTTYGQWTSELKASRVGLLMRPEALDGDLFGVRLPGRGQPTPLPGRGYLIADGGFEVVQVAR